MDHRCRREEYFIENFIMFGTYRNRWKDNIKMDLEEIVSEKLGLIQRFRIESGDQFV
jgi:hypothetical protein